MKHSEAISYINAGGRGSRLREVFPYDPEKGIAKALLELGNPPLRLVDHHIANSRDQGINRIIIAAGDQPTVREYVQDIYGNDEDVIVTSSDHQHGTGGDLLIAAHTQPVLQGEDALVLVQNVDTILDISLPDFEKDHRYLAKKFGASATIALTQNQGVKNQNAFLVHAHSRQVLKSAELGDSHIEAPQPGEYRGSSTGAVALSADFLRTYKVGDGQVSLYGELLKQSHMGGGLFAYNNGNRFFRDVGTAPDWEASTDDIELNSKLRYSSR